MYFTLFVKVGTREREKKWDFFFHFSGRTMHNSKVRHVLYFAYKSHKAYNKWHKCKFCLPVITNDNSWIFFFSLSHMGTYKLQTEHCFTTRKLLPAFDVLFKLFVLPSYSLVCKKSLCMSRTLKIRWRQ